MRGLRKKPSTFRANKVFSERLLLKQDASTVDKALDSKFEQLKFKPVKFFKEILDLRLTDSRKPEFPILRLNRKMELRRNSAFAKNKG